jgi:hypothetical protein
MRILGDLVAILANGGRPVEYDRRSNKVFFERKVGRKGNFERFAQWKTDVGTRRLSTWLSYCSRRLPELDRTSLGAWEQNRRNGDAALIGAFRGLASISHGGVPRVLRRFFYSLRGRSIA